MMEPKNIPKTLYFITVLELTYTLSSYMIQPIFPLYIKDIGGSNFEIGLIMTLTSVFTLLSRFPIGLLADHVGKWPVIPLGLFSSFSSLLFLVLAPEMIWVYPIRVFYAIGSSSYSPTSHAIAYNLAPSKRRGESIALLLTAVGLASMMGPAFSAFLIPYLSFSQILVVASIFPLIGFVSFIVVKFFIWKSLADQQENKGPTKSLSFFSVLKRKNILTLSFFEFTLQFTEGVFGTLFSIFALEALSFTPALISLLHSLKGLTNTTIRIPIGKISDKIGRKKPYCIAASLLIFTYFSLSIIQNFLVLCFVILIYGIGFGTYKVMTNTLYSENVPPENRSAALTIRYTTMGVGRAVGSFSSGVLVTILPMTNIFLICSLVIALGLFVFIVKIKKPDNDAST